MALPFVPPQGSSTEQSRSLTIACGYGTRHNSTRAKLSVTSTPDGADIEMDGSFVGNTPSDIDVPAGGTQSP